MTKSAKRIVVQDDIETQVYQKKSAGAGNQKIARDLGISEYKVRTILDPGNQKILFLDIETAPNLGYTWAKYEQTVIDFTKQWYMLSFSVKWLGTRHAEVFSLADFPGFRKDSSDDKALCEKLHGYLDEAQIVCAHNGDKFDIKKVNSRMVLHGLRPPSPYKTVDTLKLARKHFAFTSNKLGDIGSFLGLGEKVETGGFQLWKDCVAGNRAAFRKMAAYNKQDVLLLEKVYLAMRPWATNHPSVTMDSALKCQICGSSNVQYRGYNYSRRGRARRCQCLDCYGWTQGGYQKRYRKP